jgi:two-component system, sensor histidine kinase
VVRLPLVSPVPQSPDALAPILRSPARPRRILVVDDNESFASAVAGLLRTMGHEVRTGSDGAAAITTARGFRPHVVLLDIALPDRSGYDVAREPRQDPALAAVRIIAITGYGQEQDRRQAMAAGIDRHLAKPVNDEVLQALIEMAGTD